MLPIETCGNLSKPPFSVLFCFVFFPAFGKIITDIQVQKTGFILPVIPVCLVSLCVYPSVRFSTKNDVFPKDYFLNES